MSIVTPGSEWPPKHYAPALAQLRHDRAILSGDLNAQNQVYTDPQAQPVRSRFQYNGGVTGAVARGVLGRPTRSRQGEAHVEQWDTLPFDLATLSADVLVGEPPRFTLDPQDEGNTEAAEALAAFAGTDLFAADLHQAFRSCAGLGWVYGRVVWDTNVDAQPWIEWVEADNGIPEFANGRLTAITFWDTFERDRTVFRLLQRHSPGRIEYELWVGSQYTIGRRAPLTELAEAEHLADVVDAEAGINTGTDYLTAVMIPNLDRAPQWSTDPYLRYLGMSDVVKGGGVWRTLNLLWTDLMHEVDSARARLIIPEHYLYSRGPGQGMDFEWFRDVYTKPQSGSPDAEDTIDRIQFDMRVQQYLETIDATRLRAISSTGWSNITFGLENASADMTATEIRARSTRTIHTHKAKSRFARAGLGQLLTAWLATDAAMNGYPAPQRPVNVSMAEPVQATELDEANTLSLLRQHQLVSQRSALARLHPEWTDTELEAELAELARERAQDAPYDPFANTILDEPLSEE